MVETGYDPIWDEIYENGHQQKAPWDSVVSFFYSNKSSSKQNSEINILEVGCGTASNLRFFANEGVNVSGIDASETAINVAKTYFQQSGLEGDLRVGSFDVLPFESEKFDLVIDRAALVHAGTSVQTRAINEIRRVLLPKGRFLYTPYAVTHESHLNSDKYEDDLSTNISAGTLQNVGHLRFMSHDDILSFFQSSQWSILNLDYEERRSFLPAEKSEIHSAWRVILEKA